MLVLGSYKVNNLSYKSQVIHSAGTLEALGKLCSRPLGGASVSG